MDNEGKKDLENLIISTKLSKNLRKRFPSKISNLITRINQDNPVSTPTEKKTEINMRDLNEHNSSSLLEELLHPIDNKQRTTIKPGLTIRSTYCIDSKIGSGGMGDVWKAIDLIQDAGESKDKYVAIKFISHEISSHEYALKALVREFGRYKKLIHPNIVKAYELNHDHNEVYIAMEFLEGITLKTFIKEHPDGISLEQAKPIIKSMCNALEYAHNEGIIHLDFKPGNVFYDLENKLCKVIDFGIARLADPEERDKTRFDPGALGAMTTSYASCEMLMGIEPDPRDDIYALSCVIYELLSGRHPFNKKTSLIADREKIQAKQIPKLRKDEFQALQRGLIFNKASRTSSAQKLYSELYEPQQLAYKKRTKWIIVGSITAILMIVFSFALYKAVNSWQLNEVKTSIKNQVSSGISDFTLLSKEEQKELLQDHPLRIALVKNASNSVSNGDSISIIDKFDPNIQQTLYADRKVRKYLITSYQKAISQAINEDSFQLADKLSQRLKQQYPDSIQLVTLYENIKKQKRSRQLEIKKRYRQCLEDQNKNLISLFPCLQKTRVILRKIDNAEVLLTPSKSGLSSRYTNEISSAINKNMLVLADTLISNWRSLEKDETTTRKQLDEKLAYANKVSILIKKINESNDTQLAEVLKTLPGLKQNLKQDILTNKVVKNRLMEYYSKVINLSLNNNDFRIASIYIAEGLSLLSNSNKEQKHLKQLEKKANSRKTSYLNDLEQRYYQQLLQKEPNIQIILTIQSDVSSIAPKNLTAQLPGLLESYAAKIDTAIINDKFDLAERLFNSWKKLKPSDSNSKTFTQLTDKKTRFLQAFQIRNTLVGQLKMAIKNNQLDKISALIVDANKQLSIVDQEKIITTLQEPLIKIYQYHIDMAIQQNDFDSASKFFTQIKSIFPTTAVVLKNKSKISEAKALLLNKLFNQSKQATALAVLDGPAIFSPLNNINSIDSGYLKTRSIFFQNLRKVLIKKLDQEGSSPQMKEVIDQWDSFIKNSNQTSEKAKELFRKTKNLLALRCLFNGRKLKTENQHSKAHKLFIFGLSLEPVNSVRNALEDELL